jgi:hypothetical protein
MEPWEFDRAAIPLGGQRWTVRHADEVALEFVLTAFATGVGGAAHALLFSNSSPFVPRQAKPTGFFEEWRKTDSAAFRHARQTA